MGRAFGARYELLGGPAVLLTAELTPFSVKT